jgi:hypothetical protein
MVSFAGFVGSPYRHLKNRESHDTKSYLDRLEHYLTETGALDSGTGRTGKTPNIDKITPTAAKAVAGKTGKITNGYKTDIESLGMIVTWAHEFGYVSIHDPVLGEWWDVLTKDAPAWALNEARRRKELYKDGNLKAYRLTSREMQELWEKEHPPDPGLIEEEYPVEEENTA